VFFLGSATPPGFHRTSGNRARSETRLPGFHRWARTSRKGHHQKAKRKRGRSRRCSAATLVIPQPGVWYDRSFVAEESKSLYEKSGAGIANSMAQFLLHAVSNGMNDAMPSRASTNPATIIRAKMS